MQEMHHSDGPWACLRPVPVEYKSRPIPLPRSSEVVARHMVRSEQATACVVTSSCYDHPVYAPRIWYEEVDA